MLNQYTHICSRLAELNGRAAQLCNVVQSNLSLLQQVQQEIAAILEALRQLPPELFLRPAPVVTASRVLRVRDVAKQVGLGRSTIWQLVKEGQFPQPIRLSGRSVGWLQTDLDEWLKSRTIASGAT
jgi:prophage regulatory protein